MKQSSSQRFNTLRTLPTSNAHLSKGGFVGKPPVWYKLLSGQHETTFYRENKGGGYDVCDRSTGVRLTLDTLVGANAQIRLANDRKARWLR